MPRCLRDYLDDSTESRIVLATVDCIASRGIAATSTHEIAKQAGLSQGNIHYYFRSRDVLMRRVLELLYENSSHNISSLQSKRVSPRVRLELIIDLGFDLITRRRDEFVTLIACWSHAVVSGSEWQQQYKRTFHGFQTAVVELIREGERSGEFMRGASKTLPILLVSMVQGIGLQLAIASDEIDPKQVKSAAKRAVRALLHPQAKVNKSPSVPQLRNGQRSGS